MADQEHMRLLKQGVRAWNKWRADNPKIFGDLRNADLIGADLREATFIRSDLSKTDLSKANLSGANLRLADLSGAHLRMADLSWAQLHRANLSGAYLRKANLNGAHTSWANLNGANLSEANLCRADLNGANLSEANLSGADLSKVNLSGANLSRADLSGADLSGANLDGADLSMVNLCGANLSYSNLVEAKLLGADLTECNIYGISIWNIEIDENTKQNNLFITKLNESVITVDNLEVAQFIYLMLNNQKIRDVINTITSKIVLILGRFTLERKMVLDTIREELRKHDFTPVMFDFDKPNDRNFIDTIATLAHMAKFIIADFTDPKVVLLEAQYIIPNISIPLAPIFLKDSGFKPNTLSALRKGRATLLNDFCYKDNNHLNENLYELIIKPAEILARELKKDSFV